MFRVFLLILMVIGTAIFALSAVGLAMWAISPYLAGSVPSWMTNPTAVGTAVAFCLVPFFNKWVYKMSQPICRQIEKWPDGKLKRVLLRDIDADSGSK